MIDFEWIIINLFYQDSRVVWGGGASEISCSLAIAKESFQLDGIKRHAFRYFSDALESIPLALAENRLDILPEICIKNIESINNFPSFFVVDFLQ